jgi:putative phage-type endonuclease
MGNEAVAVGAIDRARYIGGSDAAAILGLSPWATPYQVWLKKTGQALPEPADKMREKVLKRGKKLEPYVLEMLVEELEDRGHEVEVLRVSTQDEQNRYQDADLPFLAAEIDAELKIDGEDVNAELKTVHAFQAKQWGEQGTDDIPPYYTAQTMHGLMVRPKRLAVVGALIGADDLRVHLVERDDDVIAGIRRMEVDFWRLVETRTPPPEKTLDDLALKFPTDNGDEIALEGDELIHALLRLRAVKAKLKGYELEEAALEFQLKRYMGNAQILTLDGKKAATWKGGETSRFDLEAFRAENKKLATQFTKKIPTRPFRLYAGD